MAQEITEQQAQQMLREFTESKTNQHSFLRDVIQAKDTTRLGNLNDEELGMPQLELRGVKELEIFSKEVYQDKGWETLFIKMGNALTDTSLSKDGFLMRLSVTNKKEIADTTIQERKKNKGWFRKKE